MSKNIFKEEKIITSPTKLLKNHRNFVVPGIILLGGVGFLNYAESSYASDLTLDFNNAVSPQMSIGQKGLDLIESFEGEELTGYVLGDGMCTIGYGHAVPIGEKPDCTSWTITEAQAEEFLRQDVERFSSDINEYFCRSFNQNQFDALVSFSYNVGQAYKKYDWPCDAPDTYFPGVMIQYTNPPKFKEGLTRRREAEIDLFKDTSVDTPVPSFEEQSSESHPIKTFLEDHFNWGSESKENTTNNFEPTPIATVYAPAPVQTYNQEISPLFQGGIGGR